MSGASDTSEGARILRRTVSVCPLCLDEVPARVVSELSGVYLYKDCPAHPESRALLSASRWYYEGLNDIYFRLNPVEYAQKEFFVEPTNRCNLNCPICFQKANDVATQELTIERFLGMIETVPSGSLLDFMGAEPTLNTQLPVMIEEATRRGYKVALHTNGTRLSDLGYLSRLRQAGLQQVYLQFDGWQDSTYRILRGEPLARNKQAVLRNLTDMGIPTVLQVTVASGVNDHELGSILLTALHTECVRGVIYVGLRKAGRGAAMAEEMNLLPEDLIDQLSEQTQGTITKRGVFAFQKLFYLAISIFKLRKCMYNQFFFVRASRGRVVSADRLMGLARIEQALDRYAHSTRTLGPKARLGVACLVQSLRPSVLRHVPFLARTFLSLARGRGILSAPRGFLLLGFTTVCDRDIYDEQVQVNCGKGVLNPDQGRPTDFHSAAKTLICRERTYGPEARGQRKNPSLAC